ncbi:MAG: hypothetical protein LQ347_006598, partial [Umbilicaria vellea]
MASLLLAAGAGVYYKVKDTKAKHKATRDAHNSHRFSELEKENTARLAQPRSPELASNNPFRDAPAPTTTQRTNSHTKNP